MPSIPVHGLGSSWLSFVMPCFGTQPPPAPAGRVLGRSLSHGQCGLSQALQCICPSLYGLERRCLGWLDPSLVWHHSSGVMADGLGGHQVLPGPWDLLPALRWLGLIMPHTCSSGTACVSPEWCCWVRGLLSKAAQHLLVVTWRARAALDAPQCSLPAPSRCCLHLPDLQEHKGADSPSVSPCL